MKYAGLAALGIGLLAGSHAGAMPHCGDRETVVAALMDRYAEAHIASGLQSDTGLMEIWASDADGSWTILMTRPDGHTCVVASGTHWLTRDGVAVVEGDPV